MDSPLPDVTPSEWRSISRLNFGKDNGYMHPFMHEFRFSKNARALMLKDENDYILGWALLVPTKYLDSDFATRYAKSKTKYSVQLFVRRRLRGHGYGKMLMDACLEHDTKPLVFPHDVSSGGLFKNYKVTSDIHSRKAWLKKSAA